MSENQKDCALEMNFRKSAVVQKGLRAQRHLKEVRAKMGLSIGRVFKATTDFGSRFVRNSPSDTNITIVATVNFSINAS